MKRSITVGILTLFAVMSTASTSQACLYIPWLDPFAWLGFYGCGGGYGCGAFGGGCGYGGCAPSYGYGGYQQQAYVPQVPVYAQPRMMNYPLAPAPGCNCTSAAPQPQMAAVRVPVTTYRAVTQYVPQTTYQTQYRPVTQSYAAAQPTWATSLAYGGSPMTAYASPSYGVPYATAQYGAAYNTAALPAPSGYGYPAAPTVPAPVYPPPGLQGGVATPLPTGDINGDHEYPSQSALDPRLTPYQRAMQPIRPVSYTRPTSARAYPSAVR